MASLQPTYMIQQKSQPVAHGWLAFVYELMGYQHVCVTIS